MTFTSAVLGEVHPTNIIRSIWKSLREMHCTHSILADGWIQTKLRQGNSWVYIVSQELALAFGYCRDTVHRHLKELCERGILQRNQTQP